MNELAGFPAIAGTTSAQTIQAGGVRGQGSEGPYRALTAGPGEPHTRRLDLAPGSPAASRRRPLLSFAQITDIHLQDEQSPGRFEFANRFTGPAPLHLLTPSYRPQEFLQAYVVDATIRAINALGPNPATGGQVTGGQVTGGQVDLLVCTGDLTDNCQVNELRWAIALLEGSEVRPQSGGASYEGIASAAWGDAAYWHPDRFDDEYKQRWGFPTYPGLLEDTTVLHWHGDTFSLPEGATRMASSKACPEQGFFIPGKYLALQFHMEVDPGLVQEYVAGQGDWPTGPYVQAPKAIISEAASHC